MNRNFNYGLSYFDVQDNRPMKILSIVMILCAVVDVLHSFAFESDLKINTTSGDAEEIPCGKDCDYDVCE